jgi:hypothetical protein
MQVVGDLVGILECTCYYADVITTHPEFWASLKSASAI